jgi:carbon monoxide dehydrogenase subunit G
MAKYHAEIIVDGSPEAAFAYLTELGNLSEWDSSVRQATLIEGSGPGVGSRYDVTVGFYGKALDATYEITEFDEPRRISFSMDGKASGHTEIVVEQRGEDTVVIYDSIIQMSGVARLLDRGLQLAYDGIGENIEKGIAKQLRSTR